MKDSVLKDRFPDPALQQIITAGSKDEVSEHDLAPNLFKSPERDKYIELFLNCLINRSDCSRMERTAGYYAVEFSKYQGKISDPEGKLDELNQKLLNTFKDGIKKQCKKNGVVFDTVFVKQAIQTPVILPITEDKTLPINTTTITTTQTSDDKVEENKAIEENKTEEKKPFGESFFIRDFAKVAKDEDKMKKLNKELKKRSKDSGIHYGPPDFSDVKMVNGQNSVLCKTPKPGTINEYYNKVIEKNSSFLVGLCSPYEGEEVLAYWSNDHLSKLQLKDGWQIINDESQTVIYEDGDTESIPLKKQKKTEKEDPKKWFPRLVERKLIAKKGEEEREITHVHYENWADHKPAPSLKLLEILFGRQDALANGNETAVFVNCRGGQGRTGIYAMIDFVKKEIDAQLKSGKKLDEIELNVPEMAYQMRLQRPKLLSHGPQLAQVYAAAGAYYEKLKSQEVQV